MLAIQRNTLYIYGGLFESGAREYTLDDFYTLQLDKLDRFECLKEATEDDKMEWKGSDSESGDEDDDDDDDDDDDGSITSPSEAEDGGEGGEDADGDVVMAGDKESKLDSDVAAATAATLTLQDGSGET